MSRKLTLAAAQMGATHLTSSRSETLQRMLKLLQEAASQDAHILLFPEIAFTTFFPRHLINDQTELDSFFEQGDITTSPQTAPLFQKARELNIDIVVGFAELCPNNDRFNSCIYYHAQSGSILSKYRKIHLPGDFEPFPDPEATNQLEKRYFKPGDLGFEAFRVPDLEGEPIVGMLICNDRRWPEAWRCLGLQGVQVVFCGYNTAGYAPELWGSDPSQTPEAAEEDALFQHKLVMQSNSYMNSTFSVCAARCGFDDGRYNLIAGSCIIDPNGRIVAEAKTKEDEIVVAEVDLDRCEPGKKRTFDFERHRRVEHYSRITERTGVVEPPKLHERKPSKPVVAIPTKNDGIVEIDQEPQTNGNTIAHTANGGNGKEIRILLVNPNATESMTEACISSVQPTLPPNVSVHPFTGPPNLAPTAIEGHFDAVLSSAACARALIPLQESENYNAILVACYSDHPLTKMLREEFEIPVLGIFEASLLHARLLGGRFGIVATGKRSVVMHADAVRALGMTPFCAGIEACDLGVLDLERLPRAHVVRRMREVAGKLVAQGAEVLTLGCAGMTGMKSALDDAVGGDGVRVVDGVVAGVQLLAGMVKTGGKTSKVGVWKSSKVGRERRGQEYV
ncbi:N-carbamoyl-D-amino acid hydrolase [Lecanosticta acicola]|uniref:N-carbamoyl-D-amino acid hydrolase n=1 Tax=Lecanosticta acicola TaxID=111012 RepID=A0AAI8W1E8_9PEZI|nr:N-carbamoyl-D-amino acid hydrolase [Lecanosticta acicola]